MSESGFRKPYQAVQERHDETLGSARLALTEVGRQVEAWDEEQPGLEHRLGHRLETLWKDELGLRPLLRFQRKVPAMPRQRLDRRLRRLRRKRLPGYRKALRRLEAAATDSGRARKLRLRMAFMELRLRVSPVWAFLLLAALALALVDRLVPSAIEDFFTLFVADGSGP